MAGSPRQQAAVGMPRQRVYGNVIWRRQPHQGWCFSALGRRGNGNRPKGDALGATNGKSARDKWAPRQTVGGLLQIMDKGGGGAQRGGEGCLCLAQKGDLSREIKEVEGRGGVGGGEGAGEGGQEGVVGVPCDWRGCCCCGGGGGGEVM